MNRRILLLSALFVLAAGAVFGVAQIASPTPALWTLDTTISNPDNGISVGVETDKLGNLLGVVVADPAAPNPATPASAELIVDGVRTVAAPTTTGRWVASVPLPGSGRHDVRVETRTTAGQVFYWEALGVKLR